MHKDNVSIAQRVKDLIEIPSPSGYTGRLSAWLKQQVRRLGLDIIASHRDSFLVHLPGRKGRFVPFVSAHFDTLGAMVSELREKGRVAFSPVGYYHLSVVENENVTVMTHSGKVFRGTIMNCKPTTHVYTRQDLDAKRTLANMEVRLDVAANSKDDLKALGIGVGDFICLDPRFEHTDTGFIKSRFLDDKTGVAILLENLAHLSVLPEQERCEAYFHFSDLEEIGYGANVHVPQACNLFLAVDMGAVGKGLETDEFTVSICAKDAFVPYSHTVVAHLVQLAQADGLDYAVDVFPHYGSDIIPALNAGFGGWFALFGPGVSASHSYERTHDKGLYNAARLLYLLLTQE